MNGHTWDFILVNDLPFAHFSLLYRSVLCLEIYVNVDFIIFYIAFIFIFKLIREVYKTMCFEYELLGLFLVHFYENWNYSNCQF